MKKVLSVVLCLIMVLGSIAVGGDGFAEVLEAFSVKASAASSGTIENGLSWILDDSGTLTISGTGEMNDQNGAFYPWYDQRDTIKTAIIKAGVTSIGMDTFIYCSNLTSVTIPNTVTSISPEAFYGCSNLTSITIPDSVEKIGLCAFRGCSSLRSISIPSCVSYIGLLAFGSCYALTSITVDPSNSVYHSASNCLIETESKELIAGCKNSVIPTDGSVTSIGDRAFQGCRDLTSITIPYNITSVASNAFFRCYGLTSITVDNRNTVYHSTNNCLIESASKTLIAGCKSSVIPNDGSVTSIGEEAFGGCTGLTSMTIPDSVTSIGSSAFYNCTGLTSVTIGNSVTSIGNEAFYQCTGLKSITIPDSVTSIGIWAFEECTGLTSVTIGNSVTSIGNAAFYHCVSLTSVTIPDSVTSIGNSAFYQCTGLKSITIPDSVTSIGSSAFEDCAILTDVYYLGPESGRTTISIGTPNNELENATWHYIIHVTGVAVSPASATLNINDTKQLIAFVTPTNATDTTLFWSSSNRSVATVSSSGLVTAKSLGTAVITVRTSDGGYTATSNISVIPAENIYNLGEETYSFENYGDSDSPYGHCFGMAVTSSGYYLGELDKSIINGNADTPLYSFSDTAVVRKPICHYLHIQGPGAEYDSIVAGGNIDLHGKINTGDDWNSCVNYVKNHNYDNKGSLNIGMYFAGGGGHAVNFLYYKEVNGQQRIYAYDNNLPNTETYYYKGSDGYIHQFPDQFGKIIGFDLMDVNHYFTLAEDFDTSKYIYANKEEIVVEGAKYYYMKCGTEFGTYVMYEIPEGKTQVTVTPLTNNAEFTYNDEQYKFENVGKATTGTLTIIKKAGATPMATFEIENAPDSKALADAKVKAKSEINKLIVNGVSQVAKDKATDACNKIDSAKTLAEVEKAKADGRNAVIAQRQSDCTHCGLEHSGFFGFLIKFFHSILALFGNKYTG